MCNYIPQILLLMQPMNFLIRFDFFLVNYFLQTILIFKLKFRKRGKILPQSDAFFLILVPCCPIFYEEYRPSFTYLNATKNYLRYFQISRLEMIFKPI